MNLITDPFRSLVRKKLWPVALLLVAALVAMPFLLAKQPEAPITAASPAKKEDGLPATFVSVAEDGEVTERRRVLGEAKDPFAPAELDKKSKAAVEKAKAKEQKAKDDAKADAAAAPTGGEAKTGGATGGGETTAEPPASDAPAPAKTYPQYSIKVRFGPVDGDQKTKTVERLAVLPSVEAPVLVYRGVEEGGKVAVFELTGSVTAQGDGDCKPSPEDCQVLRLRAGETQFITVNDTGTETDAQYQLELVKIHTSKTAEKSELSKASTAGRKLLSKLDRKTRYAFDGETGTLRKVKSLSLTARRASL
jgi:hypothetical protein